MIVEGPFQNIVSVSNFWQDVFKIYRTSDSSRFFVAKFRPPSEDIVSMLELPGEPIVSNQTTYSTKENLFSFNGSFAIPITSNTKEGYASFYNSSQGSFFQGGFLELGSDPELVGQAQDQTTVAYHVDKASGQRAVSAFVISSQTGIMSKLYTTLESDYSYTIPADEFVDPSGSQRTFPISFAGGSMVLCSLPGGGFCALNYVDAEDAGSDSNVMGCHISYFDSNGNFSDEVFVRYDYYEINDIEPEIHSDRLGNIRVGNLLSSYPQKNLVLSSTKNVISRLASPLFEQANIEAGNRSSGNFGGATPVSLKTKNPVALFQFNGSSGLFVRVFVEVDFMTGNVGQDISNETFLGNENIGARISVSADISDLSYYFNAIYGDSIFGYRYYPLRFSKEEKQDIIEFSPPTPTLNNDYLEEMASIVVSRN